MTAFPTYLENTSGVDDVARMVTALTEEVWVLRDLVMVMHCALVDADVLAATTVDDLVPDATLSIELAAERQRLIRRVLGAPVGLDD
jgi:hypothetical protein